MGFFKYPYTDLNELNLDWVIAKIKYIEQAKNIIYDNSGTQLISNNVQDAITEIFDLISTQGVTSFNGRTGDVVPEAGDYTASQVTFDNTNTGYTATDVQAAIDEADAKIEAVSQAVPVTYVETFNSRSGAVAPAAGDYNGAQVSYDNSNSGLTATDLQGAVDELAAAPGGVTSFNNRTGAVVPLASDYDAAQVDFDDTVAQTGFSNVQGALEYVATRGASAQYTTYDNTQSGLTATNVQDAIDEVANDVLSSGVASFNGRTGAVNPQAGDYDGSDIDYDNTVSGLTATDVQAAIDELASSPGGVSSFNGRTGAVVPVSGDYDLTDLGDVNISSPTNDQVLKYDAVSQKWVNGTGGAIPAGYIIDSRVEISNTGSGTYGGKYETLANDAITAFAALGNDEVMELEGAEVGGMGYSSVDVGKVYDNTTTTFEEAFQRLTATASYLNLVTITMSTTTANNKHFFGRVSTTPAVQITDYTNTSVTTTVKLFFRKLKRV